MQTLPGMLMEILPPQLHMHLPLLSNAGMLEIFSCPPGVHGAVMTGAQGIGVSTPHAAAVADATVGLLIDWHIPKDIMFSIGLLSMMLAIGLF